MRSTIIFMEDLRGEVLGYRLLFVLFIFQLTVAFLLDPGQGGNATTESLLEEAFYVTSVVAGVMFSVLGSASLSEEGKGTLATLFLTPISVWQYLKAKLAMPFLSWTLAWLLFLASVTLMQGSLGTVPAIYLATAMTALYLSVAGAMLLTILLTVLARDLRVGILSIFSLIFLHLVLVRPFYLWSAQTSHILTRVAWFLPFLHADRAWIWSLNRYRYENIAVDPALELSWLLLFSIALLTLILMTLRRRYRRSIGKEVT